MTDCNDSELRAGENAGDSLSDETGRGYVALQVAKTVAVGWALILGMVGYTLALGLQDAYRRLRGRSA